MRGVFVTGTDTGVGKTVVGCALLGVLAERGLHLAVRKPVESGCEARGDGLHPADGDALRQAAGAREPLDAVTPLRLRHALSPERAAALEGVTLDRARLLAACEGVDTADFVLVEGAGGFLSPLAADALNADLAAALGLPLLVVVADRLGCINHALLTIEAIERRGLTVAAVVVNAADAEVDADMTNRDDLARRLPHPVLAFGHGEDDAAAARLAEFLLEERGTANGRE